MLDQILSQSLYSFSGFIFAVCTCRYTVLAIQKTRQQMRIGQKALGGLYMLFTLFLMLATWIILPLFLYSRSPLGGFIFIAALLFFFSRAHKQGKLK